MCAILFKFITRIKCWEAMELGNCPKREHPQKWLGRVQKVFWTQGAKSHPRVFCTTQTLICTSAKWGCTGARGVLLAGSKRPVAPSHPHFWGCFSFRAVSQLRGFLTFMTMFELFRGLQLQLSRVFRSNSHYSYSFLVFEQNAVTGENSPQKIHNTFQQVQLHDLMVCEPRNVMISNKEWHTHPLILGEVVSRKLHLHVHL